MSAKAARTARRAVPAPRRPKPAVRHRQDPERPISVQARGYQLKLDSPSDPRTDQFIATTRISLAPEPGATRTGGVTTTGTIPQNISGGM